MEIEQILGDISETEKKFSKSIWSVLLSKTTFMTGFKNYVAILDLRFIQLYKDPEFLVDHLKTNLEGEPWAWKETKVAEQLTILSKNSIRPSKPQNLFAHLDEEGLILAWDARQQDTGIPLHYEIHRREENKTFEMLEKSKLNPQCIKIKKSNRDLPMGMW